MTIFKKPLAAIFSILLVLLSASAFGNPVAVEIIEQDGKYQLLRGGEPYHIKGAGLEDADIATLVSHGGNSIRTWRTEDTGWTAKELLDTAARHNVTVSLCIEIGRERKGFDYNDEAAVSAQFEYARGEVLKYKDHPALLTWIIGNEPNLNFKNPKVFDAINDISKMIHELDKHHPTTTALAGFDAQLAGLIRDRAPDLDFVSIQMYGDIVNLPRYMKELGYTDPYFVTEYGSIGHWEVRTTAWGAPVESTSSEKAANYLKSHEIAINSQADQVIGSYVFYWGQKQERTPTWYGMFLKDGSKTETIDVMHRVWTGNWPDNSAPQVMNMQLNQQTSASDIVLAPKQTYRASVTAKDPDRDPLQYIWEIKPESQAKQVGGDKEVIPPTIRGLIEKPYADHIRFQTPKAPGAYRLFVYVRDGMGHAGHANIPFLVE